MLVIGAGGRPRWGLRWGRLLMGFFSALSVARAVALNGGVMTFEQFVNKTNTRSSAWERSVRELFLSTLTDDKLYASLAPRPRRTQGPSGNVTSNASTAAAAKLLVASSLRDDGILKPNELSRYDTLMNTGQVNNVVDGNQRTHPEPEHTKIASWTPGYFTQTLPPMTARASPAPLALTLRSHATGNTHTVNASVAACKFTKKKVTCGCGENYLSKCIGYDTAVSCTGNGGNTGTIISEWRTQCYSTVSRVTAGCKGTSCHFENSRYQTQRVNAITVDDCLKTSCRALASTTSAYNVEDPNATGYPDYTDKVQFERAYTGGSIQCPVMEVLKSLEVVAPVNAAVSSAWSGATLEATYVRRGPAGYAVMRLPTNGRAPDPAAQGFSAQTCAGEKVSVLVTVRSKDDPYFVLKKRNFCVPQLSGGHLWDACTSIDPNDANDKGKIIFCLALSIGICACHLIRKRNLKRADAKPNFDPVGRDSVDTTTMVHGDAQQEYPGPGGGHTQTYPGVPMQMQGAVVVAPVYAVATAMPVAQPQP